LSECLCGTARSIPPFPGSNPGAPARQSGLCGVISRCGRTADVPRGLAGNGRVFGEENRALPHRGGVFLDESLLGAGRDVVGICLAQSPVRRAGQPPAEPSLLHVETRFFKIVLSREIALGMKRTRHQLTPAMPSQNIVGDPNAQVQRRAVSTIQSRSRRAHDFAKRTIRRPRSVLSCLPHHGRTFAEQPPRLLNTGCDFMRSFSASERAPRARTVTMTCRRPALPGRASRRHRAFFRAQNEFAVRGGWLDVRQQARPCLVR
jgi:hypothetical protein